jgi:hypothetical protein
MKIEVNIKKKFVLIILGSLLIFSGIFFVYAAARDTAVNHGPDQIDWGLPIRDNIRLDGKTMNINSPAVSGGWARGIDYYVSGGTGKRIAMLGLLGSGSTLYRLYMGFGEAFNSTLGLVILPSGNVGIGTNNPRERLEVNGAILEKGFKEGWGRVNLDGSIKTTGSGGWNSKRLSLGNYEITFSPCFSEIPIFVGTAHMPHPALQRTVQTYDLTSCNAKIYTAASGSTAVDVEFSFIVKGKL